MGNPVTGDVMPTKITRWECDLMRPNLTICCFLEHCLLLSQKICKNGPYFTYDIISPCNRNRSSPNFTKKYLRDKQTSTENGRCSYKIKH